MAKTVFRPNEIKAKPGEVTLKLIHDYSPVEEVEEAPVEEYTGPTPDDLRREAEAFKTGWEIEKKRMLEIAQASADDIVKKAEEAAFAEVKRQTDQAQIIKSDAEQAASKIIEDAKLEAERIIQEANVEKENIKATAHQDGYKEGHEQGFMEGQNEVNRLVERVHKIVESVMVRREEILCETEQQIVELVLLMTRKVVKIISENQKTVVLSNVLAALKKIRTRGNITLRVNTEDLKLTTAHVDEFIKRIENVNGISVIEDSSVDKGGCIVETDFGAIDARISSQLAELESKIMEISPVKSVSKSDATLEK
ncbi:MAG: flagellar assembly protein FliH [Treponema sp.]|jgi:flagellar assembly protein FliH|nr:flagellar assembly protein FliH [Treponema sp.]MBQ5646619.1 flagellar assembly protein FliH [Treponema sp.]